MTEEQERILAEWIMQGTDEIFSTCPRCDEPTQAGELCSVCQRWANRAAQAEYGLGDGYSADEEAR